MSPVADDQSFVFMTGATGFVGQHVLAELLRAGQRCVVLLRPRLQARLQGLAADLRELGVDLGEMVASERLVPVEGTLESGRLPEVTLRVDAILHAAAATNFQMDSRGEPRRTNIEGTRALLSWAETRGIPHLHLVSSAYTCGRTATPVPERFNPQPPPFHNAYEESKWEAERLSLAWADAASRTCTIYRPSVVVGDWKTGRSTRFAGFYLSARATEFLNRSFADADAQARQSIPLRIRGRADDCQNIVPVDYVGAMIAAGVRQGGASRVYHITHPHPPTNALIKAAFESYFEIGGGRFVDPAEFATTNLNEHEERFYEISRSIGHYFVDTPVFLREGAVQLERASRARCARYDAPAIARLIAYAQSANWGRGRASHHEHVPSCADYFERFLPEHVGLSRVAQMTALTATLRFIIEDEPDGEWVCRFERGRLSMMRRGPNGAVEEFGYRSTRKVFWEAISGQVHPQELFLTGRAEIFGNAERALKMAMILHAFTREFPCHPPAAPRETAASCVR